MTKSELRKLLESLTLEEKVGQLTQLNNLYFEKDGMVTGDTDKYVYSRRFSSEELNKIGSVFNIFGSQKLKKIQEEHLKHNKIPLAFMADVTFGYYVNQPSALCQAATFDTDLVEKMAREASSQAANDGINVTFSPQADVARDARWGRCEGTYGEDVHLQSEMVKAVVRGYQGDGIGNKDSTVACVKHFAAYGAPVSGKDYDDADISERTLREIYLPPFKAAVDTGAGMIMSSFNSIAGIPNIFNKKLLRGILRNEWGFDGVIISDYASISGSSTQGSANSEKDVAKFSLQASVDIDMMDNYYIRYIPELVKNGELDEKIVDEAVMRVLELKNDLGLFEEPYKFFDSNEFTVEQFKDSYNTVMEAVEKGAVLLKNDGILPLEKKGTVIVGPFSGIISNNALLYHIKDEQIINYSKLLKKNLSQALGDIPYEQGCPMIEYDNFLAVKDREVDLCYGNEDEYLKNAVRLAKKAERVIVTIGEHPLQSGESRSRAKIDIPEIQMNLLRKIYEVNKNIITLVYCGRPILLDEVSKLSKAVMCVWQSGFAGNDAIAKLLLGEVSPSGKLPMSFPRCVGQLPLHYDYIRNAHLVRCPEADYTLRYVDVPNTALYPFGYGLSYTKFEYSQVEASGTILTPSQDIVFSVNITNTGDYDADEVAQLYIRDNTVSMVARPVRQLKAFKRVHIKKGETARVEFAINEEMLKFWNADMKYDSEAGGFTVFIGADSTTDNKCSFVLKK